MGLLQNSCTAITDAAVSPAIAGTVQKSAFIGKGVELVVTTSVGDLFVFLPKERVPHGVGSAIRLAFPADEARLIV